MPFADRVSVLTPSYNQAPFLLANLDSVRAQGPIIREHIVVDGASSDGSAAILKGRSDPKLRWRSEPDRGQSDALNKALHMAQGDVVGWLNSDDVYYPEAAQRAVSILDADPTLAMVFSHCRKIDSEDRNIGYINAHYVTLEDMLAHDTIPQPSCFIRRAALLRTGGVDVSLRYAMDYDLWLRLALLGERWLAVDEVWAGFRLHDRSKSASEFPRFLPEVEQAMERALASPLLPAALWARRRELRRRFHRSVALSSYANLDLASARAHIAKALRADPLAVDGALLRCLTKSLLGVRLISAARQAGELRRRTSKSKPLGTTPVAPRHEPTSPAPPAG